MRSYQHVVALLRGIVASALQGPTEDDPDPMNEEVITGMKVGVLSTVHLLAAATADANGVSRATIYKDIGFPERMVDPSQERVATKIIKEAYDHVATSH